MDDNADLRELADHFDEAEKKLKEIEHLTDRLSIPAINELRYAGYHALKAATARSTEERKEMIDKGKRHCARAIYDVHEIGLAYHLKVIQLFRNNYKYFPVTRVIRDYPQHLRSANAAMKFLAEHSMHDPNPDTDGIKVHYAKLEEIAQTLEIARNDVNNEMRLWQIGIIIALAAIVLAGLKLVLG